MLKHFKKLLTLEEKDMRSFIECWRFGKVIDNRINDLNSPLIDNRRFKERNLFSGHDDVDAMESRQRLAKLEYVLNNGDSIIHDVCHPHTR